MTVQIRRAVVTDHPLSVREHENLVEHDSAGAIVSFSGMIRDHDHGRSVTYLEYSAHPMAEQIMNEIVHEIAGDTEGIRAIAASHRIGKLFIGDSALVVAVSADHRGTAFHTCEKLVNTIKERLPIWKHQFFEDNTDEWVNSP